MVAPSTSTCTALFSISASSGIGVPQEMGRVSVEVVKQVRQSHWLLLGLLMMASAVERMEKASSNKSDCIKLLESMRDLAKIVERLKHTIPEEVEILNKAVQVLVEGATICRNYISKENTSRLDFQTLFTSTITSRL
eukprot:Gb_18291 [translate_table: standard]